MTIRRYYIKMYFSMQFSLLLTCQRLSLCVPLLTRRLPTPGLDPEYKTAAFFQMHFQENNIVLYSGQYSIMYLFLFIKMFWLQQVNSKCCYSFYTNSVCLCRRRLHPSSHRSSSFTLLQSLVIEDSKDKPTYSVLLGQLFAFIGTTPDQTVRSLVQQDTGVAHRRASALSASSACRCPAAASCRRLRRAGGEPAPGDRLWST